MHPSCSITSESSIAWSYPFIWSEMRLSWVWCRGPHAASEGLTAAEEAHAAGGAAFETTGPPGHTPFRSSRFMPPAEDSGDGQVDHALHLMHK